MGAYMRGGSMKLRVAIWMSVGVLVAVLWNLYVSRTASTPSGIVQTLVCLTCPVALFRNHAIGFYAFLCINAATYGLVAGILETMRRFFERTRLIPG
jgi:hypothetical protein